MAEMSMEEARRVLGLPTPPPAEQFSPAMVSSEPPVPSALQVDIRAPQPSVGGAQAAGATGAVAPAAVPSRDVVPLEVRTADTSPKPSEGMTDLDVMMNGVWQVESGNRHVDPKTGKILRSHTGNLGVSQLGVATAKELGVDPYDEKQNRIGGKRYLAQMFERYGNWRDATGAYYTGPGTYDKWLDGGSKRDTKLGKEITAYQDKVLANAGIVERETAPSAQRAPDGSRVLNLDTARAMLSALPPQNEVEAIARDKARRDREGGTFLEESADRAQALVYSLYKGARDFELAPVQVILEQVSPDSARWLTNRVAEVDAPWKPLLDKHSVLSTGGEIIGGTAGLLATARLLGPVAIAGARSSGLTTVMRDIAPRAPWLLNASGGLTTDGRYAASVPVGAGIAAGTTFTETANPSDRLWLAGLGAIAGPLGVSVGQALAKIATMAVPKSEQAKMMQALKDNMDLLSGDLNHLKNTAVANVSKMEQDASGKYVRALSSGAEMRGLDADVLGRTISGYGTKAASQIEQTKRVLAERLGLDKEGQRMAQAAVLRQQYDDQVQAVARAQDTFVERMMPPGGAAATPAERVALKARVRASLENDPAFPRVTMPPPEPYTPGIISAESFMKGRQFLRQEMASAGTRAKRNQVAGLRRELDASFAAAAKDAGMSAGQFYRRLQEADKFYKSNVVPAHDLFEGWFGRRFRGSEQIRDDAVNKLTQGVDGTKVFSKVVDTIESGTQRELDAMLHVFGRTPAEREYLVKSIAYRALTKAEGGIGKGFDPLAVRKYIDDNHRNLQRVLTPEQYRWMEGFAKVTDGLAERLAQAARQDRRGVFSSRILNIFGLEHLWRGDVVRAAGLISSGMFAHTLVNNLPVLRDAVLSRIIGKMAHVKKGSPEYEQLFRQLEVQWAKRAIVGARGAAELSGVGEPQVPAFQPLRPMPAR